MKILNDNISENLVSLLIGKNLKLATAESCTGGLLSKKITDISGASKIFECGICSYSDKIKHDILNVNSKTLKNYTAVSEQTAIEMATNIRKLANSDIGVSTTGYAGPQQNNSNETVGLVFIGVSSVNFSSSFKFDLREELKFIPENKIRNYIREKITDEALNLIIDLILEGKI